MRLREEDVPGELLEELDIVRPDMDAARLVSNSGGSADGDSVTIKCATQIGRSSDARRRRRASNASQWGSHSVSMKSLLKAGCARSV